MVNKNKFYVTTTIPYANAAPHIGFALEIVQADVLARWNSLLGKEVFFLTGTDEHGVKLYQAAKTNNSSPQAFVDKNAEFYKLLTKKLNINNNFFIRTTDEKIHWPGVIKLWNILKDNGDIYKKKYSGHYCSGCERFITDKDLENNKCPNHPNLTIQNLDEENYFFRLSKYSNKIKSLIESDKLKISPKKWKNDFLSLIKDGLTDVSFSRDKKVLPWGVPVPGDESQVMYVWCDALTNYLTGLGYPKDKFNDFWPADVHVVGKDMLRFHTGIWPGMLLSAGLPLPREVIVHGFLTVDGKKMSKSLGNVISPLKLLDKYPSDSLRYVLLRSVPFGDDGDFSERQLVDRHNNELANKFGNLISRVSALAEKFGIEKCDNTLINKLYVDKVKSHMKVYDFDKALQEVFSFVDVCNEFIQENKLWESKDKKHLYMLLDSIKSITILLWSFMPNACEKVAKDLSFDINFSNINKPFVVKSIKKSKILFDKVKFVEEKIAFSGKVVNADDSLNEVSCAIGEVKGIKVTNKSSELERMKKKLLSDVKFDDVKERIDSYNYLLGSRDRGSEGLSSNILWDYIKKNKRLPNINNITDCYNLISAKYGLIMGAYDADKIVGNVNLRVARGNEHFIPIASKDKKEVKIHNGEYVLVDDSNKVITRWLTKQHDSVAITKSTKRIIVCIQGNKSIKKSFVNKKLKETCDLITKICGGEYKILY